MAKVTEQRRAEAWEGSKPNDRGLVTALSPPQLSRTTAPGQQAAMAHWHRKASRAPGTEVFPSAQEALVEKSRRPLHSEIKGEVSYWGRGGRREERGQRDGGGRAAIQKEAEICGNQSFCASGHVSYVAKTRLPAPSLPWPSHSKVE